MYLVVWKPRQIRAESEVIITSYLVLAACSSHLLMNGDAYPPKENSHLQWLNILPKILEKTIHAKLFLLHTSTVLLGAK